MADRDDADGLDDDERGLLAAAATGHLDDADRVALDALLARRPGAAAELAELRAAVAELAPLRVPGAGWVELPVAADGAPPAPQPAPPAVTPLPQAPRSTVPVPVPRQRGGRRVAQYALAACALLLVGGLGGAVLRGVVDDRSAPAVVTGPPGTLGAQEDLRVQTASSAVTATASVVAHTWGTETVLDVAGLPAGQTYRVVVVDEQGREVVAGTFLGAQKPVSCTMNAAVLRQDAARVEVLDASGAAVVSSELPPTA